MCLYGTMYAFAYMVQCIVIDHAAFCSLHEHRQKTVAGSMHFFISLFFCKCVRERLSE